MAAPGERSPDGLWLEVDRAALGEVREPLPTSFRAYRLNLEATLTYTANDGSGNDAQAAAVVVVPKSQKK